MDESSPDGVKDQSRRDFLSLRFNKELTSEDAFKIIVTDLNNLPEVVPPIAFSNRVDFPVIVDTQPPVPEVEHVSLKALDLDSSVFDEIKKRTGVSPKTSLLGSTEHHDDKPPIFVEPSYPVSISGERQSLEQGIFLANAFSPLVTAMAGVMLLGRLMHAKVTKRQFLRGSLAVGVLLASSFGEVALDRFTYLHKLGGDVLASEFSSKAKISSIRSVIIMEDVFNLYREYFHDNPVLGISASKIDGLEIFAREKPSNLKKRLLASPDTLSALREVVENIGTVEKLFSYKITDLYSGATDQVVLNDEQFLGELSNKLRLIGLKPTVPPRLPRPGEGYL